MISFSAIDKKNSVPEIFFEIAFIQRKYSVVLLKAMKSILLTAFVITGLSGLTGLGYMYYRKVKRERQQKAQEIFKSVILAALKDKQKKTKQLKDVNE